MINQFKQEITSPWNFANLNKPHCPLETFNFNLTKLEKISKQDFHLKTIQDPRLANLPLELQDFINQCSLFLDNNQIEYQNLRLLLSADNSPVLPKTTQRDKKWHWDSGQGLYPSISFMGCSCLPTEFLTKTPVLNWPSCEFTSKDSALQVIQQLNSAPNKDKFTLTPHKFICLIPIIFTGA